MQLIKSCLFEFFILFKSNELAVGRQREESTTGKHRIAILRGLGRFYREWPEVFEGGGLVFIRGRVSGTPF